ncbi:hypothetical protein OGAPHI_006235 [Ogataea philodendri]|uniref:Uncharacterized protein n=1 Tax=Ogataea philodendri TaxID=1378263 RepID=A0A9P8NZT7_9ASCO|nr:uncharacterized protein OGAPHI_006235 [Ogataea philodendri]KAH3662054.1 hypothetical protein OGAPHI_006235 [Ogataea philodendri]
MSNSTLSGLGCFPLVGLASSKVLNGCIFNWVSNVRATSAGSDLSGTNAICTISLKLKICCGSMVKNGCFSFTTVSNRCAMISNSSSVHLLSDLLFIASKNFSSSSSIQ